MFRTVVLALMGCVMSSIVAHAAGWDARTTLTNTAVTGADVQQARNAGKSAFHGLRSTVHYPGKDW